MDLKEKIVKFTPHMKLRPHVELGVAGKKEDKSRPTRFSSKKEAAEENHLGFWRGMGQQMNDNAHHKRGIKTYVALSSLTVLTIGVLVAFNITAVATAIAMHGNGALLSKAMDVNPDAVAALMNQVQVGE